MSTMRTATDGGAADNSTAFELFTSRQFVSWLAENDLSIAFSTYQSGKFILLGYNVHGELAVFDRTFERPMGFYADGEQIWLSTLYTLYRFRNSLLPGQLQDGFDRQYIPQVGYITGDIDIHDLSLDAEGRPVFVNTLFGCLATTDAQFSFRPLWKPSFLSDLAPEDRCHLNGLAMRDGRPAWVTAVSTSDVVDGWREHRREGGVVVDVRSNRVIAEGLSMPHSPRWYRNQLWVANSGTGELGTIDLKTGVFEPRVFLPGYIRGLSFCENWAIVGLSRPRHNKTFTGLALQERLEEQQVAARSGVYIVNLGSGYVEHWVHVEGVISELFDVAAVPGVRRASMIGFHNDQVRRTLHMGAMDEH